MHIHPTAVVSDLAVIGKDSYIGPFCILGDGVVIGERCRLESHVVLRKGTKIGDDVRVDSFCVVGGDPQSTKIAADLESSVRLGNRVCLREGVTINRSAFAGMETIIGEGCYVLSKAHIGHDCNLSSDVTVGSNAIIGGHVEIGAKVFIGRGASVDRFCRVGTYALLQQNATLTADAPPYVIAAGRNHAEGLNLVGLRSAGMEQREIEDLKKCYRAVFLGSSNLKRNAAEASREHEFGKTAYGTRFLLFFESGKRAFIHAPSGQNGAS